MSKPLIKKTLLAIYKFALGVEPILNNNRYILFLDTKKISKLRGYKNSRARSNHIFNLLCAIGLLKKVTDTSELIAVQNTRGERGSPSNAFTIYRYTKKRLEAAEQRASRLLEKNITMDNISNNNLYNHGLEDIAKELYPKHLEYAPDKSMQKYRLLLNTLGSLVAKNGYTTKAEVQKELAKDTDWKELIEGSSTNEQKKIYRYYMQDIKKFYNWKSPTMKEVEQYKLRNGCYIFTPKESEEL